jgi:hypothetical protein
VGEVGGHDEAVAADERVAGGDYALLAVGGQRYVCRACVPAIQRPFGLAMADYEDSGRCGHLCGASHGISLRVCNLALRIRLGMVTVGAVEASELLRLNSPT